MRLWHYKLLPFLPKTQLLSQWRELNSIYVKQDKHILINYVYDYPLSQLLDYSVMVIKELINRNCKIKSIDKFNNFFKTKFTDAYEILEEMKYVDFIEVFIKHHNNRYLLQCYYNLQEKFDRGQKDFSEEHYIELEKFIKHKRLS